MRVWHDTSSFEKPSKRTTSIGTSGSFLLISSFSRGINVQGDKCDKSFTLMGQYEGLVLGVLERGLMLG